MSSIVLFDDKKDCCGCGACMNVCPKSAIRVVEDEVGFVYPEIDRKFVCWMWCLQKGLRLSNATSDAEV